jgi:hypothetical protein
MVANPTLESFTYMETLPLPGNRAGIEGSLSYHTYLLCNKGSRIFTMQVSDSKSIGKVTKHWACENGGLGVYVLVVFKSLFGKWVPVLQMRLY